MNFWIWIELGFIAFGIIYLLYLCDQTGARYSDRFISLIANTPYYWILIVAATLGICVACVSKILIYHNYSVFTDTQSQIAQARLILRGTWTLNISPMLRHVFVFPYAVMDERCYSQFPPGFILLLIVVQKLKIPMIILDALVAGGTIVLAAALSRYVAVQTFQGEAGLLRPTFQSSQSITAWVTVLLLVTSPFFIGISGSSMNHAWTGCLLLASVLCFVCAENRIAQRWYQWFCIGAGITLGWAIMTRPLTGLSHLMVWSIVWGVLVIRKKIKMGDALKLAFWVGIGLIPMALFFMFYNFKTTGIPWVMPYQMRNIQMHRLGFHEGFSPLQGAYNYTDKMISLNFYMFGWAIGSWTLVLIWWIYTRLRSIEVILIGLIGAQTIAYSLYQFHDLLLGPRFLYECIPIVCILVGSVLSRPFVIKNLYTATISMVILLFCFGGAVEGVRLWKGKIAPCIQPHYKIAQFMNSIGPIMKPTAIIVDDFIGESVGEYFLGAKSDVPLWFIRADQEELARKLHELQGFEFKTIPGNN